MLQELYDMKKKLKIPITKLNLNYIVHELILFFGSTREAKHNMDF